MGMMRMSWTLRAISGKVRFKKVCFNKKINVMCLLKSGDGHEQV